MDQARQMGVEFMDLQEQEGEMSTRKQSVWSPVELLHHLEEASRFSILDVRNRDEFDAWKIEGRAPIQTLNIPYFDLLDLNETDEDIAAAVVRAVPQQLQDKLPRDATILAVCAEGNTLTHVAEGLRRLGHEAGQQPANVLLCG
jgi:rhodanese-related sulfurtransferase